MRISINKTPKNRIEHKIIRNRIKTEQNTNTIKYLLILGVGCGLIQTPLYIFLAAQYKDSCSSKVTIQGV